MQYPNTARRVVVACLSLRCAQATPYCQRYPLLQITGGSATLRRPRSKPWPAPAHKTTGMPVSPSPIRLGRGYEEFKTFALGCGGFKNPDERPAGCLEAFAAAATATQMTRAPETSTSVSEAPAEVTTTVTSTPPDTSGGGLTEEQRDALLVAVVAGPRTA